MKTELIILITAASIAAYLTIGAAIGGWVAVRHDDKDLVYFVTPFWPLIIPFVLVGILCKRSVHYWKKRASRVNLPTAKARVVKG